MRFSLNGSRSSVGEAVRSDRDHRVKVLILLNKMIVVFGSALTSLTCVIAHCNGQASSSVCVSGWSERREGTETCVTVLELPSKRILELDLLHCRRKAISAEDN